MKNIFLFLILLISINTQAQKQKVWLDADTGNEMDDVYAIVRLMWAKEDVDIVGLSSAHFNTADLVTFEKWNQYSTAGIQTVKISQGLNEQILNIMGMSQIAHPMGADRQMGRAWGESHPRPSKATEEMMKVIKALKPNEKLDILSLGAATNVASLIVMDTTIKNKVRLYSMGFRYNATTKIWSKNEFNIRTDLNAFEYLLNQTNLDWTIIPVETCQPYQYEREETYKRMDVKYPTEQVMKRRWEETNPESKIRILWDMALVQAYLMPQHAEVVEAMTPPENHQHTVKIYAKINLKAFYDDFWGTMEKNRSTFQMPTTKPRLGEVHYGNRVGGLTGQEGKTTHLICIEEGDQIQDIKVCLTKALNVVKGFEMSVLKKNNTVKTYTFGENTDLSRDNREGVWQPIFKVKKGVQLVGISGAAGWFIDNLRFHFDDGSTTPLYGGKGGDNDFKLVITKNDKGQLRGRLIGFWGSYTNQLETLGLVFFPKE
jgi:purine nucleosidase